MGAVNTAGDRVCKSTYIKGSTVVGVFLFPPSVLSSNRQQIRRFECFKRKQSVTERCDSTLRQWHLQMTDGEMGYKHITIIIPLVGCITSGAGLWAEHVFPSVSPLSLLCRPDSWRLSDGSWRDESLVKMLCPPCATAQRFGLMTPRWLVVKDYGEEEAVWYLTKAMAASSLQNSSSTITPSRSVMWSMLQRQTWAWEAGSETAAQKTPDTRTWCPPAPNPKVFSSRAAVWGWSQEYVESSSWDLQPPDTHHKKKCQTEKCLPNTSYGAIQDREVLTAVLCCSPTS